MPEESLPVILASLSKSTYGQYEKPLRLWWKFCTENNVSTWDPTIPEVLRFLTAQLNEVNSYGTLNSYRSALSLVVSYDLGKDPTIKRFCKGASVIKPQKPKYNDIWDPDPVLTHLSSYESNSKLCLEKLTKKLVTLLALATAQRLQTLSKIKVENIKVSESDIKIYIIDRIKTSAVGRNQPLLYLPFLNDKPELCVANLLQEYLSRTNTLRPKNEKNCFLTYKKPHKAATSQTISRWIRQTLEESGIETNIYSGYSTRHAATSAAQRKGVNIESIRKTAGWTEKSNVFVRFYNLPLREPNSTFVSSVFNSTV